MIFASDLDGTLIYSKKHISESQETIIAEKKEEEVISYVTEKAFEYLKQVNEKTTFIPVTTRTYEQYKRIWVVNEAIKHKYAIIDNGARIIIDDGFDEEWNDIINNNMQENNIQAKFDEIYKIVDSIFDVNKFKLWRICDGYFLVFVSQYEIPIDERYFKLTEETEKLGFVTCIQGRKLYLIPKFIDKARALEYLKSKIGNDFLICSGDSKLDASIIEIADLGILPKHNIMEKDIKNKNIIVTEEKGIRAGEEILSHVLEFNLSK